MRFAWLNDCARFIRSRKPLCNKHIEILAWSGTKRSAAFQGAPRGGEMKRGASLGYPAAKGIDWRFH